MLLSTTPSIEGKTIKEYRGVVFGEVVNGIHFFNDLTASISNVIGGRVSEYEEELVNNRAEAIKEMMNRSSKIGANAIVGVKVDYETISNSILMVIASGTAVVIE